MRETYKEDILKLASEGKSYNAIRDILGVSKGTISYYLGEGQKQKTDERAKKNKSSVKLSNKTLTFKNKSKGTYDKTRDYQRRGLRGSLKYRNNENIIENFYFQDVLDKFGEETVCYLTGRKINLNEHETYQFDHIVPPKHGGLNTLANLGITCREANLAKSDLQVESLLSLCKEILEYQGFLVIEKEFLEKEKIAFDKRF